MLELKTYGALLAFATTLAWLPTASAQDEESSPEIKLGSSRIGGPGLTKRERAVQAQWDEPEEYLTEETLPPPGDKKRIPGLFVLLMRYHDGQAWKDACEKLDMIVDEGGEEAIQSHPRGTKMAGKAFYECAKMKFVGGDFDKTEALLARSEKYGGTSARHTVLREKIIRESYRKKLSAGDISGAVKLYNEAQAMRDDEDERIWMGEQLATKAWTAYETKNEMEMKDLMARLEQIAPMNVEYRRLKEKIEGGEEILYDVLKLAFLVIGFVVAWGAFSKWRAKQKVKSMMGSDLEEF